MIYITGDTHLHYDIAKLFPDKFPEQNNMTKQDYVIVCGDFGGVWDNSSEEMYWRKWLNERSFTTLFVDGNHENFDLLNQYEVKTWNGGKVHFINDSIIHLMRGQIYTIEGMKFFTMGGGTSIDKLFRKEGKSWWKEELPTNAEFNEALDNLEKHKWSVDYVITHTTSMSRMEIMGYIKENNTLNSFFDILEKDLIYKQWFFGHFHDDIIFDDLKHTLVYNNIIKLT